VTHDFAHIGRRAILLNARLLIGTSVGKRMIVLVMLDITDKKKMADDLKVIPPNCAVQMRSRPVRGGRLPRSAGSRCA